MSDERWDGYRVIDANTGALEYRVRDARMVEASTGRLAFPIRDERAGISLAPTAYRGALGARLVSLRDFLLLFFFLDLGARLEFTDAAQQLTEALVLSVFVLVGNPLIVVLIMAAMRYPVRVGFLAGLTVAQISEFSLILAALGLSLGHITNATVSLITVVGLITIGGSTYLIMYSHPIYERVGRWLAVLERPEAHGADRADSEDDATRRQRGNVLRGHAH